jgi:hypothetical protein
MAAAAPSDLFALVDDVVKDASIFAFYTDARVIPWMPAHKPVPPPPTPLTGQLVVLLSILLQRPEIQIIADEGAARCAWHLLSTAAEGVRICDVLSDPSAGRDVINAPLECELFKLILA